MAAACFYKTVNSFVR